MLWLTVDQLRPSALRALGPRLSEGGFRALEREGLSFSNASYRYAITETAPGHASLFTGAAPREHGIVGNSWLTSRGELVEAVSDPSARPIGPGAAEGASASPRRLLAPTIGDALRQQTSGRSRVVAVSVKDRGAVLPAGLSGQAFWLGKSSFTTSSYYTETVPEWLSAHHARHPLESYLPSEWRLLEDEASYRAPAQSHARAPAELGRAFPHPLPASVPAARRLKLTPFGDVATLELALAAREALALGADDDPDLLAVSLSGTDQIGHYFGPESREYEDHLLRLDRALAEFLARVAAAVGERHLLVVLSADHGGLESTEHLQRLGLTARNLHESEVRAAADRAVLEATGQSDLVRGVESPYIYLDRDKLQAGRLDLGALRRHVAKRVGELEGVLRAHALGEPLGDGMLDDLLAASVHPERSGDIYVVPLPYTAWLQEDDLVATHGSPYSYDAHVPLILRGVGIPSGRVSRPVDVQSLAGTVAALLDLTPPALARRELLSEALD